MSARALGNCPAWLRLRAGRAATALLAHVVLANRVLACAVLALAVLALAWPPQAQAQSWAGFYDRARLEQTRTDMVPGIEENWREVVWPKLTASERTGLAHLKLRFPLELAQQPMNFFAHSSGVVELPVSALRFLADICLAYAWLNAQGYDVTTVHEYVAALKYRGPNAFGSSARQPLQALGVPAHAGEDARVQRHFQRLFGTAVVFVLAHEAGHVLFRHGTETTPVIPQAEQAQEREADAFALEVMRRIGDVPVGAVPFFNIAAHLETFATDPGHQRARLVATHPTSGARLRAVAEQLKLAQADYARIGNPPAAITLLANEITKVAKLLEDPELQVLMRSKGQAATLASLQPRRPGASLGTAPSAFASPPAPAEPTSAGPPTSAPDSVFSGRYAGRWLNTRGTDFKVTLNLRRQGANVSGEYVFGAGTVQIEAGVVEGDRLHYKWRWGRDHFGRGLLESSDGGRRLKGTWGYTERSEGGGTWQLERAP